MRQISVQEALALSKEEAVLVDVRQEEEFSRGSIPGAVNIPAEELEDHAELWKQDKTVYLFCHTGRKSAECVQDLEKEGKELLQKFPGIPVYTADYEVLVKLTGFALTRGMLCAMTRRDLPSVEDICKNARRIAILENVVNPTNIGAIFRSAAALHMDAILLTPGCCDPLYRRAARVSMGTVFQIPWTYFHKKVSWPEAGMELLRSLGFKTVAMALRNDSISIDAPALQAEEKLAIILGAEGDGLVDATITGCDYTVKIPMSHEVDSLNVAAASAVAFWELGKR